MHEWGDSGITAVLLAIGVALLLSFVLTQQARTRAARYKEIRRLQSVAAEEARREEAEALAEYSSMVATRTYHCAVCLNPTTTRCSRCKTARYCSSKCQAQHWKEGHKQECRPPEPVPSPGSSSNGSRNFSDVGSSNDSPRSGSGSRTLSEVAEVLAAPAGSTKTTVASNGDGTLLKPKKILFPYEYFVKYFNWEGPKVPPCGLLNCGNSCFANVVLQCLTHTRPLTAFLLEGTHGEECRRSVSGDWCFMCELQDHVWTVKNRQNPISPIRILSRIRNIGNHLGYGRQEDAHEFMRFAIDSMQSICLDEAGGEKSVDPRSQETTFIHYIFGGHLQSQVKCMQCLHESNRYENMMDLAVEIHGCVETLEDALAQFTAPEWLDGENKYKCDRCNAYVKARKRLTLHEAPNILTIALKRFQSGKFGKLNKRVTFPEILDVSPYMSGKGDQPPLYKLYGVVVHVDMLNASFFGHYICYVKDSLGLWYKIDDSKVKEVDLEKVMAQRAYMLLYARSYARPPPFTDGPVSPYPVVGAADLDKIISDRHGGLKVFPSPQYLTSEEMLEGGGDQGLHAMVDFNQLVDYVDEEESPETKTVSEHFLSNGEVTTLQPRSWEIQRVRSDDDEEIELEDAGCIASSSSITQTSPCMSSFTSTQGLWIPTQGFVCQVPESGSVEETQYAPYDPKTSLHDDFSEVSLQPCTVENPCSTKIGKRRLEDSLSPLPSPKPLDTDQLPAWPIGSQGRPNSCAPSVPRSSGTPSSCSMSDDSQSLQLKDESEITSQPSSSGTISVQERAFSDLVFLPMLGESSLDTESSDHVAEETTGSGDEEVAAPAKRQHVEIDRAVEKVPISRTERPEVLQAIEHSNSSDVGGSDMDWDATSQHPGSPTSEAMSGPVDDLREEDPSAGISESPSDRPVVMDQQTSFQSPPPSNSERPGSPSQGEVEVDQMEEPHGVIVVTSESSEMQVCKPLQDEVLGVALYPTEVTGQTLASQSVDQTILEEGLNATAPEKSNSTTGTPAITVQANNGSLPSANGSARDVADKPRPESQKSQKSKPTSKPLFAPGFLNKARSPVGSKDKSSSNNTSVKPSAVEKVQVERVEDKVGGNSAPNGQNCSCNGETHAEDVTVVPEVDQLRASEGECQAAVNNNNDDDTPTAPTGEVSSRGNFMNGEMCNSAHLDNQIENSSQTEGDAAPDMEDKKLAKNESKDDHRSVSSKATKENASANGTGSSLNSPRVNVIEEPSVEPGSEAVAAPGRPASGKQKQGRNETCNCGSQRKWKKCCGKMGVMKSEVGRRRVVV
ncbi:unnamed protein product [Calypogeia fissa]